MSCCLYSPSKSVISNFDHVSHILSVLTCKSPCPSNYRYQITHVFNKLVRIILLYSSVSESLSSFTLRRPGALGTNLMFSIISFVRLSEISTFDVRLKNVAFCFVHRNLTHILAIAMREPISTRKLRQCWGSKFNNNQNKGIDVSFNSSNKTVILVSQVLFSSLKIIQYVHI